MNKFEEIGKSAGKSTAVGEVMYFLSHTKKWWLLPIVVILVAFGVLVALSGTAAAPFIYTLF